MTPFSPIKKKNKKNKTFLIEYTVTEKLQQNNPHDFSIIPLDLKSSLPLADRRYTSCPSSTSKRH